MQATCKNRGIFTAVWAIKDVRQLCLSLGSLVDAMSRQRGNNEATAINWNKICEWKRCYQNHTHGSMSNILV